MLRADSLFATLIKRLGLSEGVALLRIRQSWHSLVGGHLADHTAPSHLNNGELLISVDSPMMMQHLRYLSRDVIAKLAPFGVRAIRFRLGTPQRRQARSAPQAVERALTEEDRDFLGRLAGEMPDDELRDAVTRAAEKSLKKKR